MPYEQNGLQFWTLEEFQEELTKVLEQYKLEFTTEAVPSPEGRQVVLNYTVGAFPGNVTWFKDGAACDYGSFLLQTVRNYLNRVTGKDIR